MNAAREEPLLKKRDFALAATPGGSAARRIEDVLMAEDGVLAAQIDIQKAVLRLEYDLTKIRFEDLEKRAQRAGLRFSRRFRQRWKRGMAKFTEQNELDSLNAPVSSCCEDPREKAHGPR
jgi:hypothetical protein